MRTNFRMRVLVGVLDILLSDELYNVQSDHGAANYQYDDLNFEGMVDALAFYKRMMRNGDYGHLFVLRDRLAS